MDIPKFAEEALEDDVVIEGQSRRDALDSILRWNGIIGFTDDILETIDWLNTQGNEDDELIRTTNAGIGA